jgi:predicted O-linked N-acetylglucosamine transferase (SPINDLY family)
MKRLFSTLFRGRPARTRPRFERALALHQVGQTTQAQTMCEQILRREPQDHRALHLLGLLTAQTGNAGSAVELIGKAVDLCPDAASYHIDLGIALQAVQRPTAALESYERAIGIDPDNAQAHFHRGNALRELKKTALAIASFDRALEIEPDMAEAWYKRGNALLELGSTEQAIADYDRAVEIKPDYFEAFANRGVAFQALNRLDVALANYNRALAINPEYALAHCNRGLVLELCNQMDAALASYERAAAINPNMMEAVFNRAQALQDRGKFDAALAGFQRAMAIDPSHPYLFGAKLRAKMFLCDWNGLSEEIRELERKIENGEKASVPFPVLAMIDSPATQYKAARIYADDKYPPDSSLGHIPKRPSRERIRVGYFSGDFYHHATAFLMAELFELHDRERFEWFGFSFSPHPQDEMRERVARGIGRFIEVGGRSDREVAQISRDLGIDIAVDLKGYTSWPRPGIFAHRAAPIQVSYLGYPGTTGAAYMDYVIADETLIPSDRQAHYSEKVAYLPGTYQVNDRKRAIADKAFSRAELGLPENAFVFCCFNNCYKITPDAFDGWMRILQAVPSSVLWLLSENEWATANLRHEAQARGVAAERLVFARRMPPAEHLARHRQADLFLDTLPLNAHTTASDALWAGLPVLTRIGESFGSRVAASLLHAIELPDLIAPTQQAYEALAIALASEPARLTYIKKKLSDNRLTTPLFDTPRFARHIEAAYLAMYERYHHDLPPDHIAVP